MSLDPEDQHLRVFSIEDPDDDAELVDEASIDPETRPAVSAVLDALQSGKVTAADLIAFSDVGSGDLGLIRERWRLLEPSVRSSVVNHLRDMTEERFDFAFGRVLRIAMTDELANVRQFAVGGLWEDEGDDLPALLLDVMDHDDSIDVRAAAAAGLLQFAERAELGELDAALGGAIRERLFNVANDGDEDWHVRRRAAESASVFSSDSRLPQLVRDLYDEDELGLRATAVFAMGRSYDVRWLQTVIDEFENDDAEIRYEAARAAGNLADVTSLPGLSELAKDDEDAEVRQAAIAAIGSIGGPGAIRILRRLSDDARESDAEGIDDALIEASIKDDPLSLSDRDDSRG